VTIGAVVRMVLVTLLNTVVRVPVPPGEEGVGKVVMIVPVEGIVTVPMVPVPIMPVPVPLRLPVALPGAPSRWILFLGLISRRLPLRLWAEDGP